MPKRKKIIISTRFPTIIDLARAYGKKAMIQACGVLIRIEKSVAHPDKNAIESMRKDLKILIKTKSGRKRQ